MRMQPTLPELGHNMIMLKKVLPTLPKIQCLDFSDANATYANGDIVFSSDANYYENTGPTTTLNLGRKPTMQVIKSDFGVLVLRLEQILQLT